MLTLRYNEPVFILMLRGRMGCLGQPTLPLSIKVVLSIRRLPKRQKHLTYFFEIFYHSSFTKYFAVVLRLRQPTLRLSIRINTGLLYRNVSILNYKRDKDNVS